MRVLITGGAGYIGSHIVHELVDAGHAPIVIDSLVNGRRELLPDCPFYHGDIADHALVERMVRRERPQAVIHCAARIIVPESHAEPALYYHENVVKSLSLIENIAQLGVRRILFSSSASVYAPTDTFEVTEDSPVAPHSPYARTKLMVEYILEDLAHALNLHAVSLRYFNPIGADRAMRTGTAVRQPSHVLGRMLDAARGKIPAFTITGTAHPTPDGTGIRDFIHVSDVARAHVRALVRFDAIFHHSKHAHYYVMNVGTGHGTSVRELLTCCVEATGIAFPVEEGAPRPGDVVGCYANCRRAEQDIEWSSQFTVADAIQDHFRWLKKRQTLLGY